MTAAQVSLIMTIRRNALQINNYMGNAERNGKEYFNSNWQVCKCSH